MAAPKNPNTAAATAATRRKAQERKAAELRAAGWTATPPCPVCVYGEPTDHTCDAGQQHRHAVEHRGRT